MDLELKKKLIAYLEGYVTEKRIGLIENNLKERTKYVTVVLEDIYQPQNASAVIRSCDCFGIQNLHVIENTNKYTLNPKVVMGASKWVDLYRYNQEENNSLQTIQALKAQGYRIVATTPHTNDTLLPDFDLSKGKAAFFFGTELTGISDIVMDNADEYVKIPMYGFTESFNISVSAALILSHLANELRKSDIDWQLTPQEFIDLKLEWLIKSTRNGEGLVRQYLKKNKLEL